MNQQEVTDRLDRFIEECGPPFNAMGVLIDLSQSMAESDLFEGLLKLGVIDPTQVDQGVIAVTDLVRALSGITPDFEIGHIIRSGPKKGRWRRANVDSCLGEEIRLTKTSKATVSFVGPKASRVTRLCLKLVELQGKGQATSVPTGAAEREAAATDLETETTEAVGV